MKNGTPAPILGALISVRGGFDSGFGRLSERRPSAIVVLCWASGFGSQAAWKKWPEVSHSTRRAGERGGARVGKPKWVRILTITGGASIAAMIFKLPPQFGQCSMSISKTRLSKRAQRIRAGE